MDAIPTRRWVMPGVRSPRDTPNRASEEPIGGSPVNRGRASGPRRPTEGRTVNGRPREAMERPPEPKFLTELSLWRERRRADHLRSARDSVESRSSEYGTQDFAFPTFLDRKSRMAGARSYESPSPTHAVARENLTSPTPKQRNSGAVRSRAAGESQRPRSRSRGVAPFPRAARASNRPEPPRAPSR